MGEKLSFYKLLSGKNYFIEVPIIQRDYVQGRKTAEEIRLKFLSDLKEYLDKDTSVELDFIYGSVVTKGNKEYFIPLDGQQRLTTLFLLHWFLAFREDKMTDFRGLLLKDNKMKFSYETRISSREFCLALVTNSVPSQLDGRLISEAIKDSSWFFSSWEKDPTIESMLVVIDQLNLIFDKTTTGYYDKLVNSDNSLISFQFIELKEFGLTDSLYVKMNSRGKELTEFENFKARFEQCIKQIDSEDAMAIYDDFAKKIDRDWTDLFWSYRDPETNLFDSQLMNFIRVIATNYYASTPYDKIKSDSNIRLLIDNKKKVSFFRYEEMKCFTSESIKDIIKALDIFKNKSEPAKTYVNNQDLLNEQKLFNDAIKNDLNYTERVIFFSLYKYLMTNTYNQEELFEWIRVIKNLAVNTIYNGPDDFNRSIRSVNQLLPYSNAILSHLANGLYIEGFAPIQVLEERIKAILIKKGDANQWRDTIYQYERHGYFDGQIDFLLKFAGIKDYFKVNNNLSWRAEDGQRFYEKFIEYGDKATVMFIDGGLDEFDDFLWRRAILTKGDYLLLTANKKNKCFLVDDDRDTSWKRLLRDDTPQRDLVGLVLDNISIESVKDDLSRMIKEDNTQSWWKYFIKRPKLFDACGTNRFIRFDDEDNVLLLTKSQTNGLHREYYSYALAIRLEDMGNRITYPGSYSVGDDRSIEQINDKTTYICYVEGEYQFWVSDDTYKGFSSEDEIIDYLQQNNYLI
jgi:hypothetical protein